MDARATRRGIPAGVIWGGFGVLAWAAFSILTGGGAAHADDQGKGPLDGLTGLVSTTVSAVTAPLTPVVTEVVAPVVTAVVAPVQQAAPAVVSTVTTTVAQVPVAGPVVAPVVQAVANTAQAVTAPVTDVLTGGPVSQITAPVVDVVAGLPIVGGLLDDLGVIGAVDDVVGIVDDTTGLIGGVTGSTLPPVLEALVPATPGAPGEPGSPSEGGPSVAPGSDDAASALLDAQAAVVTGSAAASARASGPGGSLGSIAPPARGSGPSSPADDPAGAPLTGAPVTPTSSAGSGGGSSAATARVSDDGASPLRAWTRDSGAPDDALPASPVADTDVSPD